MTSPSNLTTRWLRNLFATILNRLTFTHTWPSWAVEAIGGALIALPAFLALATGHRIVGGMALGLSPAANELYERYVDPWGYNPSDVIERARAIILLAAIAVLLGW